MAGRMSKGGCGGGEAAISNLGVGRVEWNRQRKHTSLKGVEGGSGRGSGRERKGVEECMCRHGTVRILELSCGAYAFSKYKCGASVFFKMEMWSVRFFKMELWSIRTLKVKMWTVRILDLNMWTVRIFEMNMWTFRILNMNMWAVRILNCGIGMSHPFVKSLPRGSSAFWK